MKYTAEILGPIVAREVSVYGVLRALGLKFTGGSHGNIKKLIIRHKLDTSHFLGRGSNCGAAHKGPAKKSCVEILVHRTDGYREKSWRLRRALLESGVKYQCARCGCGDLWCGASIVLQVDHLDGDHQNCTIENLRFLCPNCHSQTSGWSGSLGLTELTSTAKYSKSRRVRRRGGTLADSQR